MSVLPGFRPFIRKLALLAQIPLLLGLVSPALGADSVQLAWDPVTDSRVDVYQVAYGTTSGRYPNRKESTTASATVDGLNAGSTYYFAVRACDATRTLCSGYSNEVSATLAAVGTDTPPSGDTVLAIGVPDTGRYGNNFGSDQHETELVATFEGTTTDLKLSVRGYDIDYADEVKVLLNGDLLGYLAVGPNNGLNAGNVFDVPATRQSAGTNEIRFVEKTAGWTWGVTDLLLAQDALSTAPPPVADFSVSTTSGEAPLAVAFTDTSSGDVDAWAWDFGDGGKESGAGTVTHTYQTPGVYTVSLTVTGSGGSDTETKTQLVEVLSTQQGQLDPTPSGDLVLEAGEITLDHTWLRVDFQRAFVDPVVIVKPLGDNELDPAVVRVDAVDGSGFRVRIEEWDYLDGVHGQERASYLVVERGRYELPNGTWLEAGRVAADADGFVRHPFAAPFAEAPVVLATVTSRNEADAVTTRLRDVDPFGFELMLQEQEANARVHAPEAVDYIAWEPSVGELDGRRFEVGRTADAVTHQAYPIAYVEAFAAAPAFLAEMQSTDGGDTAALRWANKTADGVEVWVEEEQSGDSETNHTTETVGYVALAPSGGDVTSQDGTELIVDNRDVDTEAVGTWKASSGPDPWAGESLYSNSGGVFRWLPAVPESGRYRVYAWWTYHKNRSSSVPYRIGHDTGEDTVVVNQQDPNLGGRWNLLGEYDFAAGQAGYVEVSSENGQASADAVRFVKGTGDVTSPPAVEKLIVDNQDPATENTGSWRKSSGPDPWAGESLYSKSGGVFRWRPTVAESGRYQVFVWWTYHKNRSSNVPYRIGHAGGVDTVEVNQQDPNLGGRWNLLGEFAFAPGEGGYVEVSSENGQASADAVQLVRVDGN